jgi:hypothetical protein
MEIKWMLELQKLIESKEARVKELHAELDRTDSNSTHENNEIAKQVGVLQIEIATLKNFKHSMIYKGIK